MKSAARPVAVATALLAAMTVPVAPAVAAGEEPQLDRVYLRYSGATRALRKLTVCEVNLNETGARKMFDAPIGSVEQNAASREFFGDGGETECLTLVATRLRATGMAAIGAVAEVLIKKDAPAGTTRKLLSQTFVGGGAFEWTSARVSSEQEFLHMPLAFCLVDTQPGKIAQLLAADETSNSERQLFNAMTAEIRNCVPIGTQQTLQPMILRGALAIAYHYASRSGDAITPSGAANDQQNAQAGER